MVNFSATLGGSFGVVAWVGVYGNFWAACRYGTHGGGPRASVVRTGLSGHRGFLNGGRPKASVVGIVLGGHHGLCHGSGPKASEDGTALGGQHVSDKTGVRSPIKNTSVLIPKATEKF